MEVKNEEEMPNDSSVSMTVLGHHTQWPLSTYHSQGLWDMSILNSKEGWEASVTLQLEQNSGVVIGKKGRAATGTVAGCICQYSNHIDERTEL